MKDKERKREERMSECGIQPQFRPCSSFLKEALINVCKTMWWNSNKLITKSVSFHKFKWTSAKLWETQHFNSWMERNHVVQTKAVPKALRRSSPSGPARPYKDRVASRAIYPMQSKIIAYHFRTAGPSVKAGSGEGGSILRCFSGCPWETLLGD